MEQKKSITDYINNLVGEEGFKTDVRIDLKIPPVTYAYLILSGLAVLVLYNGAKSIIAGE